MDSFSTELWLGTQESLLAYKSLQEKLPDLLTSNLALEASVSGGSVLVGSPYKVSNGVGVIPIQGGLVNADVPIALCQMFGITTYANLQQAFYLAAEDEEVERVVLEINSPGGAVSGIEPTLEALQFLKSKKPVATFIDSCASAAYWLGSAGQKIVLSKLGIVGSIGVIFQMLNKAEQLKKDGVEPFVVRSVEKKARVNPHEVITEDVRLEVQQHVNYIHKQFVHQVATNRRLTFEFVQSEMADGRTFFGKEAIDRRFVDSIGTLDSLINSWHPAQRTISYQQGGLMSTETGDTPMGEDVVVTENNETINTNTNTNTTGINLQSQVESIQAQLNSANITITELSSKLSAAETTNAKLEANNTALSNFVADKAQILTAYTELLKDNITSNSNALNVEVVMPSDLAGLEALNKQLNEKFQAKFPAGGVAVTNPEAISNSDSGSELSWMKNIKTHKGN